MNGGIIMFENAGSKIQTLAKVVCVLGIIISVIAGIMILSGGTGAPAWPVPSV